MELFCGSQMFSMFIEQRKDNRFQHGIFEKRVGMTLLESNVKQFVQSSEKQSRGKKVFGAFKKVIRKSPNTGGGASGFVISDPTDFKTGQGLSTAMPKATPTKSSTPVDSPKLSASHTASISEQEGKATFSASQKNLTDVPGELFESTAWHEVQLSHNQLSCVPDGFATLRDVKIIDLSFNQFTNIPAPILQLELTELNISNNSIHQLPEEWGPLGRSIQILHVETNKIQSVPASIANLTRLKRITLSSNQISSLPAELFTLAKLNSLTLNNNSISELPNALGGLPSLKRFSISSNQLRNIPNSIGDLQSVNKLNFDKNSIVELPQSLANLKKLSEFSIKSNKIVDFTAITNCVNIECLNFDSNNIQIIPSSISNLTKLKTFSISRNNLSEIPKELANLGKIQSINLTKNPLSSEYQDISLTDFASLKQFLLK